MTVYKPRSAWTSSGRGGAQLTGSKLVGIAWHWPGTSQDVIGVESEAATANRLRGYRNFHVGSRGWADVGYGHSVDQAGRVWDLRGLGRVGAHCASPSNRDANHEWHGVLLLLGDREKPSAAMIRACQDFRADVFLARWPGRTRDTGHGRAPGVPGAQTSCPGPFAAELIVDGVLTDQPQEDDMPSPKDWDDKDWYVFVNRLLMADLARNTGNGAQVTPWAEDHWPDHLATTVAGLLGYTAVNARDAAGAVRGNVRWQDGEEHSIRHTLSWVQRSLHTLMQLQGGSDAPTILAKLDEVAEADAQRDQAILEAIEAIESGDSDSALARLRDLLDAALTDDA